MSEHKKISTEHKKISLRVVVARAVGSVISAPPVLDASSHTIDYVCGNCSTVLMHAEYGQVHNLTIRCTECGSYNSTDV
jgi:DNA-directed RNA polymerase subunit RPC12/RpoP